MLKSALSLVAPANFRFEKGGGLTWSKPNRRHNSTEEEEEPEDEEDKDEIWTSSEIRGLVFARTVTPGSGKTAALTQVSPLHQHSKNLIVSHVPPTTSSSSHHHHHY